MSAAATFVYAGNFNPKPSSWETPAATGRGFGIFRYDATTGDLSLVKAAVMDHIGVGATCLDRKRNILYCVHETMTLPGCAKGGGGEVYALEIDPATGDLTELNHTPSFGSLPSHVAIDSSGKYLIVVHHTGNTPITQATKDAGGKLNLHLQYDDATTVLFRLRDDGSVGEPCDTYHHAGSGPDPEQTHPRLHSVTISPSGGLFAICDKGSDKLYFFRINRETETLERCGEHTSLPGSLPRYGTFHPTLPIFYMNHEGRPVISALHYEEAGTLQPLQTVDVLPEGIEPNRNMMQSDLRIDPTGHYLYALTRGINLISVFAIDQQTGELTLMQTVRLAGNGPRGCAISPDGRFLLVALTVSQSIEVWAIGQDGSVSPTGKTYPQPSPGNLTFSRQTRIPDYTYS